jgi:hypothetical protein
MTGASAGLVVFGALGAVAAVQTFRGWRDHRREVRHDAYVRDRDGL